MTTNGTVTAAPRRDRFASGAAVKLGLSEGDWVLVRAELTYGQQRRLAAAGLSGVPGALAEQGQGRGLTVDLAAYDLERLHTWLLDWSFKDGDGDHIILTPERIEALHPDTAGEINDALDAHIEALEAKKAPGTQWAQQARSDLLVCKAFGWSWGELMATPASVVWAAVALLNEAASDAGGDQSQEWPEG